MPKTLLGQGVLDAYAAYGNQPDRVRFSVIAEPGFARKLGIFLAEQDWMVQGDVPLCSVLLVLAAIGVVVILRAGNAFLWLLLLFSAYTVSIPGPVGLTRLRIAAEGLSFLPAWIGLRCWELAPRLACAIWAASGPDRRR
jgi:hypothetical protein